MSECRCGQHHVFRGNEATDDADAHLREVQADLANWRCEYVCPDTGARWLLDHPFPEAHGGGPPRLRQIQ
ncbi:MAG: hypothetical protein KF688_13565 [Pirellulales bacterium]|nr:hypothetical protein [Pirellulales bacterium]